jgi:hypothetical protein
LRGLDKTLNAELVLIHRDDVGVGEDRRHVRGHRAQIVARDERRRQHAPQREVGAILDGGHPVANLEHVGIVPVPGAGERTQCLSLENCAVRKAAVKGAGPFRFSN